MTDVTSGFGPWLASIRRDRNVTLRLLASNVGVTAPFLSDVEHSRKSMSFETAVRLCRELDYDPWETLRWFKIVPQDVLDYLDETHGAH